MAYQHHKQQTNSYINEIKYDCWLLGICIIKQQEQTCYISELLNNKYQWIDIYMKKLTNWKTHCKNQGIP